MNPEPLYLMIKPPLPCALLIKQLRLLLGIHSTYDRFHITTVQLGDARQYSTDMMTRLIQALDSMSAEPFDVTFDHVRFNALTGGKNRALRSLQRELVRRLHAAGLPLPDYEFRPHVSLSYGDAQNREIKVDPIRWHADELLLVKSIHGAGRHQHLANWPLEPRQGSLF